MTACILPGLDEQSHTAHPGKVLGKVIPSNPTLAAPSPCMLRFLNGSYLCNSRHRMYTSSDNIVSTVFGHNLKVLETLKCPPVGTFPLLPGSCSSHAFIPYGFSFKANSGLHKISIPIFAFKAVVHNPCEGPMSGILYITIHKVANLQSIDENDFNTGGLHTMKNCMKRSQR